MPSRRFAGQERDLEAGLDYFNARSYQVRTGRFGAPDPLFGTIPQDPQRWNRYAYALGNPLSVVDPSGLNPEINDYTAKENNAGQCRGSDYAQVEATGYGFGPSFLSAEYSGVSDNSFARFRIGSARQRVGQIKETPTPAETGCRNDPVTCGDPNDPIEKEPDGNVVDISETAIAVASAGASLGRLAVRAIVAKAFSTTVYRVFGGEARMMGRSWTTVNPTTVPNYRNLAGLPDNNTGQFLVEGTIRNWSGVTQRSALPLHGNVGGLVELLIPSPAKQVWGYGRVPGQSPVLITMQRADFYLGSSESYALGQPRAVFRIRNIEGEPGREYVLVRIVPSIPGHRYHLDADPDIVLISPRHVGVSLSPVSEWPAAVFVLQIRAANIDAVTTMEEADAKLLDWGELYRTADDASRAASGE